MKLHPLETLPAVAAIILSVQSPAIATLGTVKIIQESTPVFQEMRVSADTESSPTVLR